MKLLIELPSWLGDTVMATAAIENIVNHYPTADLYLIGPPVSIEALRFHPKVVYSCALEKNISSYLKAILKLERFDVFFSFRGSVRAKITKFLISANRKFQFDYKKYNDLHQVEKYNNFINDSLGINLPPCRLILHNIFEKKAKNQQLLGINPGATYGSAKRWYPEEFSDLAIKLSEKYFIIIFGSIDEVEFAQDIENNLIKAGVINYKNLSGKTSLTDLIAQIAQLNLFITADSGPMHIAAALNIPTISIFGPTNDKQTSQWMNRYSAIVKKDLDCQPCMKRICPLKHHNCMKLIKSSDVMDAIYKLN